MGNKVTIPVEKQRNGSSAENDESNNAVPVSEESCSSSSSSSQEMNEVVFTTTHDEASGVKHPLCKQWSFLIRRRSKAFESLEHDDDNDGTDDINDKLSASDASSTTCMPQVVTTATDTMSTSTKTTSWLSFSTATAEETTSESSSHYYTPEELELSDQTPVADLNDVSRPIWIVTTASLPWMTGTAVNPLLRAAYLLRHRSSATTTTSTTATTAAPVYLLLPWLETPQDRVALYGESWRNKTPQDQREYIAEWLQQTSGDQQLQLPQLHFYPARYHAGLSSIFAMGDVLDAVVDNDDDNDDDNNNAICLLEEPEHLNYFRAPTKHSNNNNNMYTIGIVHTNYKYYAQQHVTGLLTAPLVAAISAGLVRAYCAQIIRLSDVLQDYAPHKQVVCNVHGIRREFLCQSKKPCGGEKVYFLGKLLWAKGLDRLLILQEYVRRKTGTYLAMDIYGSGPEEEEIQRAYRKSREKMDATQPTNTPNTNTTTTTTTDEDSPSEESSIRKWIQRSWRRSPLPVRFPGRLDHAAIGAEYKIFVNPSVSEVLCTTTAEALAMGKFAILPEHTSNEFFQDFPNALFYSTPEEFATRLHYAQHHAPEPLSPELSHRLSWEAATERLLEVTATVSQREAARRERLYGREDERLAAWHYEWGRGRTGDVLRKVLGGGPVANQVQYQEQQQQQQQALLA